MTEFVYRAEKGRNIVPENASQLDINGIYLLQSIYAEYTLY